MVAYSIDTAAVQAVLRDTETELAPLASLYPDLQGGVDAMGASLGAGPVAAAFTQYANDTLLPRLRSGIVSSGRALDSLRGAVAEYVAADEIMRARAEAAAAAVPGATGSGPRTPGPNLPARMLPEGPPGTAADHLPGVQQKPAPADSPPAPPPAGPPDLSVPVAPSPTAAPPAAENPGTGPVIRLPLPLPLPWLPPRKPEPEPGSLVPLPGPPPWQRVWPGLPLPVLPNPMLPHPMLPLPGPGSGPPRWIGPPAWWIGPPGWWMHPPGWSWRPPGSAKWPHGQDWPEFRWPWESPPLPGCPGPHLLPDRGFRPPPGYCHPLVPLKNPQLIIRFPEVTDLPVARMLEGRGAVPGADGDMTEAGGTRVNSVSRRGGNKTWGLT